VETEIRANFKDPFDFANSFIGNISRGGLLVKTDKPLNIEAEFKLKFSISGMDKVFEGECKVMWVQELYDKYLDKLIPTMGCKFLDLSKDDIKVIEDFINERVQ